MCPLVCGTKQSRDEIWMLEHCTPNITNSDIADVRSTMNTPQINLTAVPSLNFQDM